MADSIFKRAGDLIKLAIPTRTVGTSRESFPFNPRGDQAGIFETPDYNTRLIGIQRFREYERLVRDVSILGAGVRLFLNLISNAVWTCNPPPNLSDADHAKAQEYADQAYKALFDMTTSWSQVVRKTASFRLNGFTIQEWTAKMNPDGTVGLLDIEHRPQRTIVRWLRDEGGTVEGVVQRKPGGVEVDLPRSKIVYAVDDTLTDSPEGVGLYRHVATTAGRLENFLRLEEIGFTTDLRGIPIARAPLGEMLKEVIDAGPPGSQARTDAEARRVALISPLKTFLEKHVRNLKTGLLLSSDTYTGLQADKSTTPTSVPKWAVELLTGDSQSFDAMSNAVNRMNQEIARVLGVEHLLLGADGAGSLALAKSKVGTFYLTVTSTLLDLCEIYDRDIIAPLAELNGWEPELAPQMGVNEINDREVGEVVDALQKLSLAGAPMMADDPAVGEIYDLLGLTRPPDRQDAMDLSLVPGREGLPPDNGPAAPPPTPEQQQNPTDPLAQTPEAGVAKVRVLRSRRNMAKARQATINKRRAA